MEIDPTTYPSRSFIRFTAQNQLVADLTGRPITVMVKRLGGESYTQQVTPVDQPDSDKADTPDLGFRFGLSLNMSQAEDPLSGDSQEPSPPPNAEDLAAVPTSETGEHPVLDEALFEEVAKITFSSNRYPELYQSCGTRRAAQAIEVQVANEIVAAYKQIKQKQDCPIVKRLNGLL